MHLAYKHLEQRLRIGEFTVLQWAGFIAGVVLALFWATFVSPFGTYVTLFSAVYLGGIPAAAAFLAGVTEFDLWLHIKALSRHRRAVGRYVAGPGRSARGYVISADRARRADGGSLPETPDLDLDALWHS